MDDQMGARSEFVLLDNENTCVGMAVEAFFSMTGKELGN